MKRCLAALLCAVMVIGCLAACGSSSSSDAETTAETEAAAVEDTTAETDAGETEAAATSSSDKVWIIATDTVFNPFEYTDSNGDFVGIDVDLIAAIAEDQGFEYELQSLGWDAALLAVQTGQADGLIAGASITDERKESGWIFSDGYYTATQTFCVGADSGITSYEDLAGQNVAVKNGTAGADFANSLKDEYGFTVTVFEDSATMYQDVVLGNSAACVEDTPIMAASILAGDLDLVIPDDMHNEGADYGFAIMDEANQELLDMFNAGLANIKENGTYDEIIAKYLGE